MFTNIITMKSYIGSSVHLSRRFKDYFNRSYLLREGQKNKSIIYRALLKYGYSKFKLNIVEYCEISVLIEREQYYIDKLKPEYNILKVAGSLAGFKHSMFSRERMRIARLGKSVSETTKLKLSSNKQALSVKITNINTGNTKVFPSIRSSAKFFEIQHSYIAKCLKKSKFCEVKGYIIVFK